MTITSKGNHSWGLYLQLKGKRDLKGRALTQEQRYLVDPGHPYWDKEATKQSKILRKRIGTKMYMFIKHLPDEAEEWTYQSWALCFTRVNEILDQVALPAQLKLRDLLIAALQPVGIHPYKAVEFINECSFCLLEIVPIWIDAQGLYYRCWQCESFWHVLNEYAQEKWTKQIEKYLPKDI